jgi:M6 family metalloprotease-like protein
MQRFSSIMLVMFCSFLLNSAVRAADPSKAFLLDIPNEIAARQFGRPPVSTMTPDDSLAVTSFRFAGDTLRLLAVLVEWTNRPHTWDAAKFDSLLFSRNVWPGGSVADYIWECSYGKVVTTGTVVPWVNGGTYTASYDFSRLFSQLNASIDYSQYDGDHNGDVDAVVFIRAGNGMEDSGSEYDIWSYAWIYPPHSGWGPYDGVWIPRWNTCPETRPLRMASNPTIFSGIDSLNLIRVFAHELHHNLGLPDLYDYDDKLVTSTFYTPDDWNDHPVYDWDVMGYYGYGILSLGSEIPSHLTGWSKSQLGWITPTVLNKSSYTGLKIYDIETHADSSLYLLPINSSRTEYFMLEYRNPRSTGKFDKKDSDYSCYFWPNLKFGCDTLDRGLLITHIDDNMGWGNNGTPYLPHYHVMVEDAGYNPGFDYTHNPGGKVSDSAQWWYPYETRKGALFSPNVTGQTLFGPSTVPNSNGYYGSTGISVRVDSIINEQLYVTITQPDADGDGIANISDNCPSFANPNQLDTDGDGIGDACDACPIDPNNDYDYDGFCANVDNCPNATNANQLDSDGDGIGNACDVCPFDALNDADNDGVCANVDNCSTLYNPGQQDINHDGIGDACCCIGATGNVDCDLANGVDISDLSALIDHLYVTFTPLCCPKEANTDGEGSADISDLSALIDYLYVSFTPVKNCL